jgi:hypothetical protein
MIYAIDVGSTIPKGGVVAFAWCGVDDHGKVHSEGNCPSELANEIAEHLRRGQSVALGIEAPQFIPVPANKDRLSKGRTGERDRSWAAPGGGYVATLALHQTAWLLREIRDSCGAECILTVDPGLWPPVLNQRPVLLCWEAFVSGAAHSGHAADAKTAAMYFYAEQRNLVSAVTAESPLSLFGAAVLWSGWSSDVAWLKKPLVVLRPDVPWTASD